MVSTHDAMKKAWGKYRCIFDHPDRQSIKILDRKAGVCPPEMVEPFQAQSQALASTGYVSDFPIGSMKILANGDELHLEATYEAA